jgi:SAM-dependent methyltransferase
MTAEDQEKAVALAAEDQSTPTALAAELLQSSPDFTTPPSHGLRGLVRKGLLRAMRPYTHHHRELDSEIVLALEHQETELERRETELEDVRERQDDRIEQLEEIVRELILTAESLRRATADVGLQATEATVGTQRVNAWLEAISAELYAQPYMADSPFESFAAPVGEVMGFRSLPSIRDGSSGYVAFEELFRGPAERVSESQRVYLELVSGHDPVLDIGCGRGEFLALLAAEGIAASGVDSDPGMVERCQALGLKVTLGDANQYLEGLQDGSLGAVFSAQVIEHVPYEQLRGLLELARRKLRPGGLLIAETVNPHRIASLKTFWVDLTHQHPIFPEVALAMCAIADFESAYVFAPTFDSFAHARFDAPSYAVVATAPLRSAED